MEENLLFYNEVKFSKCFFPGGSVVKNPPAHKGDIGSIPGLERSLEKEMTTHSSIPGNPMDRGAWWATVRGCQRVQHDLATEQQKSPKWKFSYH